MSERWGECPKCKGDGYIVVKHKDLILFREFLAEETCPRCEGTGMDGSAFAEEAPWLPGDDV